MPINTTVPQARGHAPRAVPELVRSGEEWEWVSCSAGELVKLVSELASSGEFLKLLDWCRGELVNGMRQFRRFTPSPNHHPAIAHRFC